MLQLFLKICQINFCEANHLRLVATDFFQIPLDRETKSPKVLPLSV